MTPLRRTAPAAGVPHLATFAASVPALGLSDGVLNDPGFVNGAGNGDAVARGAALEAFFRELAAAEAAGGAGPEAYASASERVGITWPS